MNAEGKEGGERKMATKGLGFFFFFWVGNKKALLFHWFLSNFHLLSLRGFRATFSLALSLAGGPTVHSASLLGVNETAGAF